MADGGNISQQVEDFIAHWSKAEASERANAQPFLIGLAKLLGVPEPSNSHADGYTFEFPVKISTGPDTITEGRIDLYRRASFVLEAKQFAAVKAGPSELALALDPGAGKRKSGPVRGSEAWDDAMWKARGQAERYVRSLPAEEPPAPFLLIVDVGHSIEVFADFTQAGRAYQAFPDPRGFRIRLADLRDEKVRERLRRIWLDPLSLDPAKVSAAVTREIAGYLATLAGSLEDAGHSPKLTAEFLTRCLFCMFAEDVGLLPKEGFRGLLEGLRDSPEGFGPKLRTLFTEMQTGTDFSVILNRKLLRFNGGLFEDASVIPLDATQLGILIKASQMQWKDVEPAIFGTLLERALDPEERHKLGAHYTPRSYVERLVLPTVIEPLRAEWESVRAAALIHAQAGRLAEARAEIHRFHRRLCEITVLDPACGTANFLYVALALLKALEGEVLLEAARYGDTHQLALDDRTVDPHQFLGIEVNPRAAAIADLVLWIGYLQWHYKIHGQVAPREPVLKKFRNIQCRDAVLEWDGKPQPVTWEMAAANPEIPGLPGDVREQLKAARGTFGVRRQAERDAALAGAGGAGGTEDTDGPDDPGPPRRSAPAKAPSPLRSAGALQGSPITVWDRRSMRKDAVTGRDVPDETKRVPLLTYPNARPAAWPQADYIVGNPPFLGTSRMRDSLGDGYAETLRAAYPDVPESADFVMYWWHKAAALARTGAVRRFGLITTNSLRQTFNRRVVEAHLKGAPLTRWSGAEGGTHAPSRVSGGEACAERTLHPGLSAAVGERSGKAPGEKGGFAGSSVEPPEQAGGFTESSVEPPGETGGFTEPSVEPPGEKGGFTEPSMEAPGRTGGFAGPSGRAPGEKGGLIEPSEEAPGTSGGSAKPGKKAGRLPTTAPGPLKSPALSLIFAIPDHPWVDTAEGAAVRIAMTVGTAGEHPGELRTATAEEPHEDGSSVVTFAAQAGRIAADLTTGADVAGIVALRGNEQLASRGVMVGGEGFIVTEAVATTLGLKIRAGAEKVIRPTRNGRDLTDHPRCAYAIDVTFLKEEEVRTSFPEIYQHLLLTVKPERAQNNDPKLRREWWRFRRSNEDLRSALKSLPRYIATVETAKHRTFQFLDANILPDNLLVAIALDDALHLGVLSSHIHIVFALASGGTLEDRPRYNKTRCFDPFPFPAYDEAAKARIRALGEELDAHRKRVQAQHPGLSLTAMYNVLEKLRALDCGSSLPLCRASLGECGGPLGKPRAESGSELPHSKGLTPKEQATHDAGLVSVLRQLHDELDAAVAAAYGFPPDLSDAEILTRLVALNAARTAEEAAGTIRWLRPDYQTRNAERGTRSDQTALALPKSVPTSPICAPRSKAPWPKSLAERVTAVELALKTAAAPVTAAELAQRFRRAKPADLAEILETLATLGRAHRDGELFTS